jgi:hypothetical protein
MRHFISVTVAVLAAAGSAWAQVPERIAFQGRLTDASNVPVNGTLSITFSLYAASTGGTALWTETQSVTVTGGVYIAYLGSVMPLTGISFSSTYWLGVQVGGDAEMTPRYMLSSGPYSLRARVANALEGLTVTIGELNQLSGIGPSVTAANLTTLTNGSNADALHSHGWNAITGKPLTFPPDAHTHAYSTLTGVPATFPPEAHVHSAVDLTSGVLPDGRLSGTYTGLTVPWGSLTGVPAGFADGVDDGTAYTAGTGISIGGTTLSIDTAVVPRLGVANTFSAGAQTIETGAAATKGLIVKGAASQTANLQEWQDSLGAVVASVSASGTLSGVGSGLTGLPWANLTGVPAGFADGVDDGTAYTAGAGLALSVGNQFSVAAGGITNAMLAAGAVTSASIATGAVTDTQLAANAVTTAALQNLAVTSAKLADDAVTNLKILDSAVTTSKIADAAVTPVKLDRAYLELAGGTVAGALTVNGVLTTGGNVVAGGSVRPSNDVSAATAANAGAIRWTGTELHLADGSAWKSIGPRRIWTVSGASADGTDSGALAARTVTISKSSASSRLRITYSDNLRVYNAAAEAAATWEVRVDGSSIASPGPLTATIYVSTAGLNHHSHRTVVGYADGISAGSHTFQVYVGATPGYAVMDAYTGWGGTTPTTFLLEVEELP